ncbi:FAD-binding and (Fe-S)-binding domain-containing protein [Micrococcoides hystricis]|uniref:FAD-binding and (Fe-S)-binding domain-containing protein n=1 Tax=Micrococcoides hystricis TaxID=1572761 RepID=A0ABV6PB33_9MICC
MQHIAATIDERISAVVTALETRLLGEVDATSLTRGIYSTDASNYRVVPEIVVFPQCVADVLYTLQVATEYAMSLTARGAGTSCAGNSIGPGIVLDFSRHLNKVLSIDPVNRTAVVQPGVVLAELQRQAAEHGLRFGPDPSTANRCTLGGMLGNNACGPHGLSYGRCADNVESLTWLTGTGEVIETAAGSTSVASVAGLEELISANLAVLRTEFGRFDRQISGFSLEQLLPENGRNLAAALVGTEGTCGLLLQATVKLVPLATEPALVVLGYPDMATAADDVPALLPHKPLALEGLDAELVQTIVRRKGTGSVPALPAGGGWLMIEIDGTDATDALRRAEALVADCSALDHVIHPAGPQARRLWQIRADGAGLAGRTADGEQAWPGWEDSAVPPEHLGPYLRELKALLASHGLSGLAYGHFGDGCIHLRIDFPLQNRNQTMRTFMAEAAALAASYGGSLSGEHGDGRARSELLPVMYSSDALDLMRQFKGLLDPHNIFNPGVVVDPAPLDADLRRPQAHAMAATDGFAFAADDGNITNAVHRCVGVGKCRAQSTVSTDFMCPSYRATADEKDSTRGRARVLQEMLNGGVVTLGWSSPQVHEALDLCLSCKACANDCPTGIDMATFKSEALHRTYQGKRRPWTHYTLGRLPQWLRYLGPFGPMLNWLGNIGPVRKLMMFAIGADTRRGLPQLPAKPARWIHKNRTDGGQLGQHQVVLWLDSFTDALGPGLVPDALEVLAAADCDVELAEPGACCGLTLISTGQLTAAKKKLAATLDVLYPHAAAGKPILGLEPSCIATLRSDLTELLPQDPRASVVAAGVRTLAEFLTEIGWQPPRSDAALLVQPHCHHYAVMGYEADQQLLTAMGCDVEYSKGCCGLAGNFGMERGHYDISVTVGEQGILGKIDQHPERAVLADGFSCRTQIQDLRQVSGRHLVQLLAQALREQPKHVEDPPTAARSVK